MSRSRVFVEIDVDGNPIRIFRARKHAFALTPERVAEWPRVEATARIRHQIWLRTGGRCEYCSGKITENEYPKMEMHEEVPRSQGGQISMENSVGICQKCHRTDPRAHLARRLHFGEVTGEENV